MRRLLSSVLGVFMVVVLFAGCGKSEVKVTTGASGYCVGDTVAIDDNYRTYYEVFVYSYCDSDGDGIGDFDGLTSKLDYIEEMGFNGIWLMPISQSTTYHKYDVVDYESIDAQYGTIEDFDEFMAACEERGIKVILDLVINHSSAQNAWFQSAIKSIAVEPCGAQVCTVEGLCREHNPYCGYYNFSEGYPDNVATSYYPLGNDWYYEGDFWDQMPDLNFENEAVRAEIEDIIDFWLEKGVGGFRLDAALHFYPGSTVKNTEVLKWITDYVKEEDPNNYLVAEVWAGSTEYLEYYKSGIDSLFNFAFATESGRIVKTLTYTTDDYSGQEYANALISYDSRVEEQSTTAIDAPFLSNHDTGRASGLLRGKEPLIKLGAAMNLFMNGNVFVYYGEELGMKGSGIDENKRAPMYWSIADLTGMTDGPPNMESFDQKFGPLDEQKLNELSVYSYYKLAIQIRNTNPEIARGVLAKFESITDKDICAVTKTYEDSTILMLYNFSDEETKTVVIPESEFDYEGIRAYLTVDGTPVTLTEGSISLPPETIVILK